MKPKEGQGDADDRRPAPADLDRSVQAGPRHPVVLVEHRRLLRPASDRPRAVLLAGATLGLVSLFAPDPTTADQELTRFIGDLPGLLGWFWEICYDLLIGWPLVLLIASLVARHRLFLLRDHVVAIGLALVFTSLVAGAGPR